LFNEPDSPFQRAANLFLQRSDSALASIAAGDLSNIGIQDRWQKFSPSDPI